MAPRNNHRVPLRAWRNWSPCARSVFNELFSTMHENQDLFLARGEAPAPARRWRIRCFNAAWIAADAVRSWEREQKHKVCR